MTAVQLPTPEPLRTIGEYEILAEIARGGMGRVYLGRRTGTAGFERHFAIKVMHHNLADDRDAMLMLLDEAHIASRMHHPNVVSVNDIGVYDGGYYLVMDYIEGCSLYQLMRRNKAERPPRIVLPIFLQALRGLHAVHTLCDAKGEPYNVIHRDISPQNLLLGLDGGCRVTDFGIAKASARFTDTRTGNQKGKLSYMPPEQLEGTPLDVRADLWSVGVTLYAALTGMHPFKGDTDPQTMHNILSRDPPPPSTLGLKPPECFDATVLKLLERDREGRHASAQEVGDELRRIGLAEELLAAHSEIGEWVNSTFGKELSLRRQRLGDLHGKAGPLDSQESMPRLWLSAGAGSNPSGERVRETTGEERTVADPSSGTATVRARSRGRLTGLLAVMLAAIVLGAVVVLATLGSDGDEGRVGVDAPREDVDDAVVTPDPLPVDSPETPEETLTTPTPGNGEDPSVAPEAGDDGRDVSPPPADESVPTANARSRRRRRQATAPPRSGSSATSAPAPSDPAASTTEISGSTDEATTPEHTLENNPYVRRE